jgi:hypothetical protein
LQRATPKLVLLVRCLAFGGIKPDMATSEGALDEVNMNRKIGDSINETNRKMLESETGAIDF